MALTLTEMEAITKDYFMLDGGKASDIYFTQSWLLTWLLKQQKGIWERPPGGLQIVIPLEYDGQQAAFYSKGEVLSSDDREALNAAKFDWKHAYGNATVARVDELANAGAYAEVKLITQRVSGGQKSLTKLLAGSIYDAASGATDRLTGLRHMTSESSSVKYGDIAEDDLVAKDGTKPWQGITTSTSEGISTMVLRTMRSNGNLFNGQNGRPDQVVMTETLFNKILDMLQAQQRFTESKVMADAGFTGVKFEGAELSYDAYCPSGYAFALNSAHVGFAVHADGLFMRSPWKIIEGSAEDKTMKIYFDGNLVCNNRKAHVAHSGLS